MTNAAVLDDSRDGGDGDLRAHGGLVTDDYDYIAARNTADVSGAGLEETKRFVGFGGAQLRGHRLRQTAVTETPGRKSRRLSGQRRVATLSADPLPFSPSGPIRAARVAMPPIPQLHRDCSLRRQFAPSFAGHRRRRGTTVVFSTCSTVKQRTTSRTSLSSPTVVALAAVVAGLRPLPWSSRRLEQTRPRLSPAPHDSP